MAFKNNGASLNTTPTVLYTVPAGNEAVVHSIFISNVDTNGNTHNATVEVNNGTNIFKIGENLPVPNQSVLVFDKPVNLEAGHSIQITASATGVLDAFISILEQAV